MSDSLLKQRSSEVQVPWIQLDVADPHSVLVAGDSGDVAAILVPPIDEV
ncbi:hypothetical protein JW848_00855 [Candidatus Bipolaricaulota bacterium]|nr:hypothetical protein [Candidatus Bipolaricaulota bacterium]